MSAWKTMDTAPKDGTPFLALCENGAVEKIAWFDGWDGGYLCKSQEPCWGIATGFGDQIDDEGVAFGSFCYLKPITAPVKWMHLPKASLEEAGKQLRKNAETLSQVPATIAEARRQALEEAAKACEVERLSEPQDDCDAAYDRAIDHCAQAIRDMKDRT